MANFKRNAVKSSIQDFSKSVSANIARSKFYRPSGLKTTFDAGLLVPIFIDEILPGDTYEMKIQHVAKLITPLTPTMDNLDLEFFAFFVPNRLVWENWVELMGENRDDDWTPSSPPAGVPQSTGIGATLENKIGDYYGLPIGLNTSYHGVNLLPFRGYILIWNEWFRNQNLQSPINIYKGDSGYTHSTSVNINSDLYHVNKPFDYFTSCLPDPQKGDSQLIPIELNTLIPVITGADGAMSGNQTALKMRKASDGTSVGAQKSVVTAPAGDNIGYDDQTVGTYQDGLYPYNLWADPTSLGEIGDTTIAQLRTAFQLQKLYERDARGGTRYIEILKSHFGVDARDYRLQRPEYLGHARHIVGINQVPQTSETNTTPQGTLTAYAHSQGNDFLFNKSFVEHGFLHVFAVARQKKTYQHGLERFWSRQDRLDYYMPVLAHISEQPIYTKEIYCLANNPDTVFGFNEPWSDYRYKPSRVSGQMRSDNTNTFEIWHYADDYASAPTLSDAWMQDNSSENIERTLAISGSIHDIKMDVRFDLTCIRPIPVNSIPGYIDHF